MLKEFYVQIPDLLQLVQIETTLFASSGFAAPYVTAAGRAALPLIAAI